MPIWADAWRMAQSPRTVFLKPSPVGLCSLGRPGRLRLRAVHPREGEGAESRGGAQKVGGGAHGLPGEGRVCPHSGEAGPLPAVTRGALPREHLQAPPREGSSAMRLCGWRGRLSIPRSIQKPLEAPPTGPPWLSRDVTFPFRRDVSAKGSRNNLVDPGHGSLILLEAAQKCCLRPVLLYPSCVGLDVTAQLLSQSSGHWYRDCESWDPSARTSPSL